MIFENVELHNVAEVRRANGGMRLQRVPEDVRLQLNEGAQIVLSITMFAGRFGPITIALFMAGRERQDTIRYASERIRIG